MGQAAIYAAFPAVIGSSLKALRAASRSANRCVASSVPTLSVIASAEPAGSLASAATAIANLGQELGYQDQAEFAKFWDADAARIESAVKEIGRVQG